jgi:hypothetical protein
MSCRPRPPTLPGILMPPRPTIPIRTASLGSAPGLRRGRALTRPAAMVV